jgi:hypothetical protein
MQITAIDGQKEPNQSVSGLMPGIQLNDSFTNPVSIAKANCHANAETTVMIAYGIRMKVRRNGRRTPSARCITMASGITMASAKPRTSSTATVITVMSTVTPTACHHKLSVSVTA